MYSRTVPTPPRSTSVGVGVAVLLALALASPALAVPAPQESTSGNPGPPTATSAWTAQILYPVAARRAPNPRARVVDQLAHYTSWSRRPQVLLVDGSFTEPGGRRWVRVRLARRPNGLQAWVPRAAVRLRGTGLRFRVSIARRVLEVYRDGRRTRSFKVAVGKPSTPTAQGLFAVADAVSVTSYLGPNIIVLTAYSPVLRNFLGGDGVAGIHGWGDSGALGRAVSNGCVRASRDTVAALAGIAKPGTPVEIVAR